MLLATALLIGVGVAFAFALQVAQLFVPARDAAWSDVVWNTLGLLAGPLLAAPLVRLSTGRLQARALRLPLTFVVLWLLLEWWPFVPRLDWQHVKDALKPLLLHPQWRTLSALEAALSLGLVGLMLQPLRQRAAVAHRLAAGRRDRRTDHRGPCADAVAQRRLVVRPAAGVAGMAAAPSGCGRCWARRWRCCGSPSTDCGRFNSANRWPSFTGCRSWLCYRARCSANTLALTWQLFWLGAVMVLLHGISAHASAVAFALSLWALPLELLQMLLPGRVSDITPALLPWLWCLALPLLHVSLPPAVTKSMPRVQINPPSHAP